MDARPVFFSFSSKDRKVAETIAAALEARGFSSWLATRDVKPGENYQVAIVHAINQAKALLLVFSSNTNASDEIKKELSLASKRRLLVIPVRVEDVLPDEGMSYELATRQWIDLFADWEAAMTQLAAQLATVVTPGAVRAGDTPGPAALPASTPRWHAAAYAAAAVGAVALIYLATLQWGPRTAPPPPNAAAVPAVQAELRCMQADPDLAIKGCSENLADPAVTGTTRAGYYKFRGASYAREFDYDRAIADFGAAIALTPRDGGLYFLRAASRRAKGDQTGADADAARAQELGYAPPH